MRWLRTCRRRRSRVASRETPRDPAERAPGDTPTAETLDLERSIARRERAASRREGGDDEGEGGDGDDPSSRSRPR
jgi:hypothetical protein